jgi:hypothetical protein
MRRFALPIAICMFASYGCAASEEDPDNGGTKTSGGSTGSGGSGLPTSGSSTTGTAGASTGTGGSGTGTAGSGTGTAGSSNGIAGSSSGTGGSASGGATGGGNCTMKAAATGTPTLIDDFEDSNADITAVDGRSGGWYLSTDGTGAVTPAAGAPKPEDGGMPGKAVHVKGTGLTKWGAGLSAAVANNTTGCYDVSKFTGVTVSLKGTGNLYVSVLTAAVRDAPEGQRNHYKKQVTLTSEANGNHPVQRAHPAGRVGPASAVRRHQGLRLRHRSGASHRTRHHRLRLLGRQPVVQVMAHGAVVGRAQPPLPTRSRS